MLLRRLQISSGYLLTDVRQPLPYGGIGQGRDGRCIEFVDGTPRGSFWSP